MHLEYLNSPSTPFHPAWPYLPSLEANVALVSPWRLETKPHLSGWPWWGRSGRPRLYALVVAFRQICCVCSWLHLLPTNSQLQGIHSRLILLFFSSTKGKNCAERRTFILKRIVQSWPYCSTDQFWGLRSLAAGEGGLAQEDAGAKAPLSLVVLPWAPDRGMGGAADREALPMTDVIAHHISISRAGFLFLLWTERVEGLWGFLWASCLVDEPHHWGFACGNCAPLYPSFYQICPCIPGTQQKNS